MTLPKEEEEKEKIVLRRTVKERERLLQCGQQLMHIKAQLEMHFVVTVDPDLGE